MKMGTILIIIGAVLMAAGVLVNVTSKRQESTPPEAAPLVTNEANFEFSNSPAKPEVDAVGSSEPRGASDPQKPSEEKIEVVGDSPAEPDYKKIGNDFEGYVADILKANGIRLKQWNQGSTSPEGAYAENELNPDFLVAHKEGQNPLEYWVECKYRSNLPNWGFSLEDYQLKRYYSIQGQSKRKIIIALGVGGSPKAPAAFYVIPLDSLYRFKRIGNKYLPNYSISDPRNNFKKHLSDWFYNEVFKTKVKK